jgi:PAS domain S-box-containing protein
MKGVFMHKQSAYIQSISLLGILLGISFLAGYQFDFMLLTSWLPMHHGINPLAAILIIFSCISILIYNHNNPKYSYIAKALSFPMLVIGIVKITFFLHLTNLKLDMMLYHDQVVQTGSRIALSAGIAYVLIGLNLFFYGKRFKFLQVSPIVISSIGLAGMLGHLNGVSALYLFTLAMPTSFLLFIIGIALLLLDKKNYFYLIISSDLVGGRVFKTLIIIAFALVFTVGSGILFLINNTYLPPEDAISLMMLTLMIAAFFILIFVGNQFNHADEERIKQEMLLLDNKKQIEELNNSLKIITSNLTGIIDSTTDQIIAINTNYEFIAFNKVTEHNVSRLYGKEIYQGMSFYELMGDTPKEDLEHSIAYWERTLSGESFTTIQEFGSEIFNRSYFELSYFPLINENGVVIGATNMARDITQRRQAEEKVNYLANLISDLSDPLFSLDNSFHIISWNKASELLFGFSEKEIIGQLVYDVIKTNQQDDERIKIFAELDKNKSWSGEGTYYKKDGSPFGGLMTYSITKNSKGESLGYIGFCKDITDRIEAERRIAENANRLREAQSIAHIGSWERNLATNEAIWSDELYKIYGINKNEQPNAVNENLNFIHPDDVESVKISLERLLTEHIPINIFTRVYRTDGMERIIHAKGDVTEYDHGKPLKISGTAQDVTEIKEYEQRLMELNGNLAKEIEERKMVEMDLERSNKELENFGHVVSHDLKAPLRAISTIANWLSDDYKDKIDEDGKQQFATLINRTERMSALIDGILKYSKVGRIELKNEAIDLNTLLPEIIESIGIPPHIMVDSARNFPVVLFDRVMITQVFQNIISNAVKFIDKPKGLINIGYTEEHDFWKFNISDNGAGIEAIHFEKIFEIFQTLRSKDEIEGTGIGLSIVKKIIENYGGKIWVESEVGTGSAFYFTIKKSD